MPVAEPVEHGVHHVGRWRWGAGVGLVCLACQGPGVTLPGAPAGLAVAAISGATAVTTQLRPAAPTPATAEPHPVSATLAGFPLPLVPQVLDVTCRMGRRTLGEVLDAVGVGGADAMAAVAVMRPVQDPRRMRPTDLLQVRLHGAHLVRLGVRRMGEDGVPQTVLVTRQDDGDFAVRQEAPPVQVEVARITGVVQSTLYESMVALREQPSLINQLVDVLGSTVDFYREVRNGDAFTVVVEKRFVQDRLVGYGRVMAVEYKQSWRTLQAFHHTHADGRQGYYDPTGRSMATAFLRTPMEFTRITSRYGMRFHPVLKRRKAHNGVDYGAPTGTPVWAVADGRVLSASWQGACGKAVMIQHANGIQTGYCHLSRIASGLRGGARVGQRQVVGYVGTTGRSTAPHLHFLMKRNGRHVNPQTIDVPRRPGLKGQELVRFNQVLGERLALLAARDTA